MIRAFLAVSLDPSIQQTLTQIQNEFKTLGCDVKWVKPHNIHLTLKFFGDIEKKQLNDIIDAVTDVLQGTSIMTASLSTLGTFPNLRSPKVVWVGLNDPENKIFSLVQVLEKEFFNLGFPKENRAFSAHIKIGRAHV